MVDNIYHFPKWFLSISIDVFCEITKKYPKKNSIFNSIKQNQKKTKQIKQKTETIKKKVIKQCLKKVNM